MPGGLRIPPAHPDPGAEARALSQPGSMASLCSGAGEGLAVPVAQERPR